VSPPSQTAAKSQKKKTDQQPSPTATVPALPAPPLTPLTPVPAVGHQETAEPGKKEVEEKIEQQLKQLEKAEAAAHEELEQKLKQLVSNSSTAVQSAIKSLNNATEVIRNHTQDLKKLIDKSLPEDPLVSVTPSSGFHPESVYMSEFDADHAKSALEKLDEAIKEGRSNATTARNRMLLQSEEELNRLGYQLSSALAHLSCAEAESRIIAEYHRLVKKGKEQFHKELESILPDVHINQRLIDGQLSEDELNSLIAHAHRRIEQLQKQISDHHDAEQQRLQTALQQQRAECEKLSEDRLERERQLTQNDIGITRQKFDEEAQVKFERELRNQLARQAAAHSDHLAEVLRVQKREMQAAFDVHLATRIDEERSLFQKYIFGWIARMRGIDKALSNRTELESKARHAQELWVACQALQSLITTAGSYNDDDAIPYESQMKPLGPELSAVTAAACHADEPFITSMVASIPSLAVSRGVWTEESLIARFDRVSRAARHVAFVSESGRPSLFRYAASYVLSMFILRQPVADDTQEIDPTEMTPFALLDRASRSLEHGNLEQALRYVNQLTGEPRRVASDWIAEARLLLETRQAADVLLAYSAAHSFASLAASP
jgi:mitofilin